MWKPTPEILREHEAVMRSSVEPERLEWYRMTPAQRWEAQKEMWAIFFELGGSLDDEESPLYDIETASWPKIREIWRSRR